MKIENTISIVELLDANNFFNHGQTSIYDTININKSDFNRISKVSRINLEELLCPDKPDYIKSIVADGRNFIPELYPEIQKRKQKLLFSLKEIEPKVIQENDNNEMFGIIVYNDFINKHFDNILDSIKSYFQNVYTLEKKEFMLRNGITLNLLAFYVIYTKYDELFDDSHKFSYNQIKGIYGFVFEQYLQYYQINFLKKDVKKFKNLYELTFDELNECKKIIKENTSDKSIRFSASITPAVLLKLKDEYKKIGNYEKALESTTEFFLDLPRSGKGKKKLQPMTLKKWIDLNQKYYPKFEIFNTPSKIVKSMTREDIMAWFIALARIDERFLDLRRYTGVPVESIDSEINKLRKENDELRRKLRELSNN